MEFSEMTARIQTAISNVMEKMEIGHVVGLDICVASASGIPWAIYRGKSSM